MPRGPVGAKRIVAGMAGGADVLRCGEVPGVGTCLAEVMTGETLAGTPCVLAEK